MTLKLAPLLADYLYQNKRLDLPGIGSFFMDPSAIAQQDSGKQGKTTPTEGISFENNASIKDSPDLIGYISAQTGKMKALAAADLSSHLELVQQFLNIGKPFLLEGIGSLVKIRSGLFEFTSGAIQAEKLKDLTAKEATATSATEESFSSYNPLVAPKSAQPAWLRPLVVVLVLAGAGLAIWGGYTVYKKNASRRALAANAAPLDTTPPVVQAPPPVVIDSPATANKIPDGNYKFVFEVANKKRAFARLNTLRNYQWNVQMETKDSQQFKIYMILPAMANDTTHLIDSFTAFNGRPVYIENQNR
jgi:hypothetical protein